VGFAPVLTGVEGDVVKGSRGTFYILRVNAKDVL